MAQLSDDCFAFGGPMMSVGEAVGLITTRVNAIVDLETVALIDRSEEHTSELQSQSNLVCRLLLEKKKIYILACSVNHYQHLYTYHLCSLTYMTIRNLRLAYYNVMQLLSGTLMSRYTRLNLYDSH